MGVDPEALGITVLILLSHRPLLCARMTASLNGLSINRLR